MNKLILLLLVSIFLGGCAGCYTDSPYDNCLGSWHLEPGTEEYIEWEKREKKRELREAKELKAKQDADDKIPIYKMCMMWDDAYNGSRSAIKTRERIAQSLERRGQDPLYCRNTSNSNDAARRAEDAAKAAERRNLGQTSFKAEELFDDDNGALSLCYNNFPAFHASFLLPHP